METEEDGVSAAAEEEEQAAEEEDAEEEVEVEEGVQCAEARRWLCRRDGRRAPTGRERRSAGGAGGTRGALSWA